MPIPRLFRTSFLALVSAAWVTGVAAQPADPPATPAQPPAAPAQRIATRFPQPVRVGDLLGRLVLAPAEPQPVLGRVAGIVRQSDGGTSVVIAVSRWFGFWARPVAVPLDAVGLLGEHVALLDVTPDQLSAAPSYADAPAAEVPPDAIIRVGLAKPFH